MKYVGLSALVIGAALGVISWLTLGGTVTLLMIGVGFLWAIFHELQRIRDILRIAHADAITRHLEDEIEAKHFSYDSVSRRLSALRTGGIRSPSQTHALDLSRRYYVAALRAIGVQRGGSSQD